MLLFWTLNRLYVTTLAPVRAGKAEKCDPSEPGRANRTPRGPQKPIFERTERPRSRSIRLFWTLNRLDVTTFAPVRAGKAQKCDPSEPARAGRIPRGPRENGFSAPAPSPLEFFTRLFLEYTILLEPFFLRAPARRTWGRRISKGRGHFRRPREKKNVAFKFEFC